jgi:hypothetical protein
MTIDIRTLNINRGGTPPVTSFSDSGGSQSSGGALGQNWFAGISYYTPFSTPIGLSILSRGNAIVDGLPAIIGTPGGSASPNTVYDSIGVPIPIFSSVWGKSQFVQFTFIEYSGVTNNTFFGGFLFYQPSAVLNGYRMSANLHVANSITIVKFAPNGTNGIGSNLTSSVLINNAGLGGISSFSNGDIIRLSGDTSVPGQITVSLRVNGVLKGSAVDGSPLVGGLPAYYVEMGTGQVSIRTFSAGLGT